MGQEHLVVPSPFTRQIGEQPPLSWAQGCCPARKEEREENEREKKEREKNSKGGREGGRKAQPKSIIYELPRKSNSKFLWTLFPLNIITHTISTQSTRKQGQFKTQNIYM